MDRAYRVLRRLLRAIDRLPHYHGAEVCIEPRRSKAIELDAAKEEARRLLRGQKGGR